MSEHSARLTGIRRANDGYTTPEDFLDIVTNSRAESEAQREAFNEQREKIESERESDDDD